MARSTETGVHRWLVACPCGWMVVLDDWAEITPSWRTHCTEYPTHYEDIVVSQEIGAERELPSPRVVWKR